MLHIGGLKAAAKRTAFGDVSNTLNLSRPSKDDSAIVKGNYTRLEPIGSLLQEKKPTALLRPAQRPFSVAGLKGILTNATNAHHQATNKQPLSEVQPSVQPVAQQCPNTRKTLTKRSTAVFKDSVPPKEQATTDLGKPLPSTTIIAPLGEDAVPQQETKTGTDLEEPQPKVRRTTGHHPTSVESSDENLNPSKAQEVDEEASAFRSDGIYVDDRGDIHPYIYDVLVPELKNPTQESASLPDTKPALEEVALNLLDARAEAPQPEPTRKHRLTTASELEEYWDEFEEEYICDEDGNITARSYKSRGENTTNGATTVLFPKVNQKVKRELAAAKDLIEGARTNEEIDDESWDTTMVAEYGDEIFQYMKELEVIFYH